MQYTKNHGVKMYALTLDEYPRRRVKSYKKKKQQPPQYARKPIDYNATASYNYTRGQFQTSGMSAVEAILCV